MTREYWVDALCRIAVFMVPLLLLWLLRWQVLYYMPRVLGLG